MRSIWKGAITFGLVNVPVKVYSATEDHDVPMHQVHDADGGRIRYQRICEIDGEVVEFSHIQKAYDDGDRTVVITPDDLASLPVEQNREIDVVEFVPSDQVDPIMYERSYYLEPDSRSPKAYVLLRETLQQTDRTAIVKFAIRQKMRLAALRVKGDVLVLQTLLWGDEVREANFKSLNEKVDISEKELKMSSSLVKSFESDFTPENFTDEYQEQLRKLIDAKLEQGEAIDKEKTFGETADEADGGEVLDLMEALRRSVERNRSSKKDDAAPADAGDDEPPAEDKKDGKGKKKGGGKGKKAASEGAEEPAETAPKRKRASA
ncbi:Ku protein [Naasia aerilata]|uniref:Non-homologous end joining protein Ku n=1 Tax=Naasia aerilata TaxID=1162966 RepID=A0ABN6XRN9_9MICO|nr:Ku protein [Naasia aerilata]BDZ47654.1 non-homologous end joining protein Ku [Naasia aerilata]